jgi:hypothetical protein
MGIERAEYDQLQERARDLVRTLPEAIGLAAVKLDCGCIHFNGVSFTGDPAGRLTRLTGQGKGLPAAICLKCRQPGDRMTSRIADRMMVWPGHPGEWPEPELRKIIAHKVFGANYRESID